MVNAQNVSGKCLQLHQCNMVVYTTLELLLEKQRAEIVQNLIRND